MSVFGFGLGFGCQRGTASGGGLSLSAVTLASGELNLTLNKTATVYYLISASATQMTGAAIKAAVIATTPVVYGDFVAVSGVNDEAITLTPLSAGDWYLHVAADDGISIVAAAPFGFTYSPDVTAPTLSGVSVANTTTTATLSWSTNEANGTAYWLVDTNATRTAAQVIAGGTFSGSRAVTVTGAQTDFAATGLTVSTAYYFHLVHQDAAGNNSTVSNTSFNTTAAYSPVAVQFDASETLAQTSVFTATGSKYALFAASFYCVGSIPSSNALILFQTAGGNDRAYLNFASSGRLQFTALDAAGTDIATLLCATSTIAADTWYTVIYALDTTQGSIATRLRGYIRPAGGAWSDLATGAGSHTATLDGIVDTCGRGRVNYLPGSSVYYSDLYARIDATLDISNSTNRDKFLPTVNKGTDGSTPTGSAPQIYLSGAVGSWHTNKGTAGGFSLTGTLSTAPSAPT